MNKLSDEEIEAVVLDVLRELNLFRDAEQQLELRLDAPLFGGDGPLDSLGLVALAMDIEDAFAELGMDISLSDERAMSQQQSPFRDVSSLVAYSRDLVSAQNDDT